MDEALAKVREARDRRERSGARYLIEVDGGITPDTAKRCATAGADVFVAGQGVFGQPKPAAALEDLRKAIE